ncbi:MULTISPECIES: hypothetical protein [Clostridium]|uniref:Peptidoglycan binding domain-containing protein n=2 Tax=Clostridium TaxID=1485 RepID=A0ABU7UV38_9CLOT|nr:hypothetical protein [Clostridium sp. DSM 17811]
MDKMVLQTQKWANETYSGNKSYTKIAEDGVTGWGTMKALITALQIELKLPSPNGNFGPGTKNAFTNLSVSSPVTDSNKIIILQSALFCKGYNPN